MHEILSLNVGMPREIQDGKRRVRTGIFKEPVTGPLLLSETQLEVTQPRVPCFKLGLRMGDPRASGAASSRSGSAERRRQTSTPARHADPGCRFRLTADPVGFSLVFTRRPPGVPRPCP
jgi:hypothetical protein